MSQDASWQETQVPTGRVEIAENAIANTIHEAVLSCYGVVDVGPQTLGSAITRRLRMSNSPRGIAVTNTEDGLEIEVSIVVEYGTPIFTVAQNVMQTVKFQVEHLLGMPVTRVDVNVDGLRVSAKTGTTA